VQDRIAVTEENRTRLIEAIETALRFGKDQVNVIPVETGVSPVMSKTAADTAAATVLPFSTGWHCPWCDLDIRPPTVGLFSFNNPLGACPDCRGFGRTIAIDLNKAIPDRSLSIKQGVVRVFRGAEFGESQKDLLRACAREDVDTNVPFDELPKADQDFVIEGERRSGEYTDEDYEHHRWYGVRGFFRWLESKTYKMHVRVLLSRYPAYVTCPQCNGGRYQLEAPTFKILAALAFQPPPGALKSAPPTFTPPGFPALSISVARGLLSTLPGARQPQTAPLLGDNSCAR